MFAGRSDGTATIWDAITGTEIRSLQGYANSRWAVTPEGEWIVNTGIDAIPDIWPTNMGYIIADLTHSICTPPDDDRIRNENPAWRGCDIELAAVNDKLTIYNALRGRPGSS